MTNLELRPDVAPSDPATAPELAEETGRGRAFALVLRVASSASFLGLLSLGILLAMWQLAVVVFTPETFILPSPVHVADVMVEERDMLWKHTIVTLKEVLAGFAIAVAAGIPIAVAIAFSRIVEKLFYPALVASQAVPKVAIAPLFLVWFGFGSTPKIAIAALIAVFPIIIDTVVGLRSIDPDMVRMAKSMRASIMKTFWKVRIPTALPNIFAGLKMGITFAVIGAVVGEFVAGTEGLGYLVQAATGTLNTPVAFASVTTLSILGILLFFIVEVVERIVLSWHPSVSS